MTDTQLIQKYNRPVPRYTSYPTAPHFHEGVGASTYAGWLAEVPTDQPLSVYAHIPFCDSMCWFCGCHTKITARYAPVRSYVDVLVQEIALVRRALGGPRPLAHLHFGGGSPSLLQPAEIDALGAALTEAFPAAPGAELAVEFDPRDLSDETIAAFAGMGINRASIGVQDANDEVQRAINRIQPMAVTESAVRRLRAAGIGGINIDLVYGLPYQSLDRVMATMDAILALRPDRVALFGYAHVPHMKTHQRLIPEDALPGAAERWDQSEAAAAALIEAGYIRVGLDHFALPSDSMARALQAGDLHRNFQGYTVDVAPALVGLGASAIGSLPDGYVQNAVPIHAYRDAIQAGKLATAKGVALDFDDRLRRTAIERLMCDMKVDLGAVTREAGLAPRYFHTELRALKDLAADGIVRVTGDAVEVTPEGRPLVRVAAAVFDRYLKGSTARHSAAV